MSARAMRVMRVLIVALLAGIWAGSGLPAAASEPECGAAQNPCRIATGDYHAILPTGWQGGPAVIHLHGLGGSGAKVIGNRGFARRITARGYALLAPNGLPLRPAPPNPSDWSIRDGWDQYPRDDVRFVEAVLADAERRFGIDRARVLMSGFSRGGSMTWEVACLAPGTAAAYAPVAGGFWKPDPTDCAGPVKLLHTHGFTDGTVPLEGRRIQWKELDITQGDVFRGLGLWRRVNGCSSKAGAHLIEGETWRKTWTDCDPGAALELVLHPGGHGLPRGWSSMALDWFEAALAED